MLAPNQLTAAHIANIVGGWQSRYARSTTSVLTKALRRILHDIGPLCGNTDLYKCVPRVGQGKPPQRRITEQQRTALLTKMPMWLRAFVLLCADLGLRFSAAIDLKTAGYDPTRQTVTVVSKGDSRQTLALTPQLDAILRSIPPQHGDTTVLEALRGKPLHKENVRAAFNKHCAAAGLPNDITPHTLRRTLATNAWEKTHDIRLVQQLLGHANLSTTARYLLDHDTEALRQIVTDLRPYTEVKQ